MSTAVLIIATQGRLLAQSSLAAAESFVRIAYDELVVDDSLGVSVTLSQPVAKNLLDWSRLPEVYVRLERGMPQPLRTRDDAEAQLLGVLVRIDTFGRVLEARGNGTHVHVRDMGEMVRFASEHADWPDANLVAELKRRGARFTDVNGLREGARLTRFEPIVGRIVKSDILFNVRGPSGRPTLTDSFYFTWVVNLETEPAPLQRRRYLLVFEPFDARLLQLRHLVTSSDFDPSL